jgi:thioredoxin-dependent peroxiredoxin
MKRYLLVMLCCFLPWLAHAEAMPTPGTFAPAFKLADQAGSERRLEDWRGKWLVLYFYPKDETSGCTAEAIAFRDAQAALKALNAEVAGVSLDDVASHRGFASNHQLNFTLLADMDGKVARSYGALFNLGVIKFAKRVSFIIDPDGRVAKVYPDVDALRHAQEVLADLRSLKR